MSQPADNETAYGPDQDREPVRPDGAARENTPDLSPDDFGPDSEDGTDVNPATGLEYGELPHSPGAA